MEIQETIIFNGKKYRIMGSGRYYLSQSTHNSERRNAKGLHVAIWEFYSGKKVPKGYVIHHKDGNSLNNNYSNLECISRIEHAKKHLQEVIERTKTEKWIKHLEKIRKKATEWHKSEEGLKWHRDHGDKIRKHPKTKICPYCGKEFETKRQGKKKYCSKSCSNRGRLQHNS